MSWRTPTQSLPQEINPRAVFYRLFGQGDTDAERTAIVRETGSILDHVTAQAQSLEQKLGQRDRTAVDEYLDSVREIERRLQLAAQKDTTSLEIPEAPIGVPNDIDQHFKMMFDLMALAFQADAHARDHVLDGSRSEHAHVQQPEHLGGVPSAVASLEDPGKQDRLAVIQNYHTKMFARFIDRLANTPDGDGTLLDHSMVLFGSNMSNSNRHNNDPLPRPILGRAHGRIKGGQHLHYPQDSRFADLLLTLLERTRFRSSRSATAAARSRRSEHDHDARWIGWLHGCSWQLRARASLPGRGRRPRASACAAGGGRSGRRSTRSRARGARSRAPTRRRAGRTAARRCMWAAYHRDLDARRRGCLQAGADVNAKNDFGAFPLSEAAMTGPTPLIKALLDAGARRRASERARARRRCMVVARAGNVEGGRAAAQGRRRRERRRSAGASSRR